MTFLLAAWSFIKSPIGKYLLIGLACVAVVFGFAGWNRHEQHKADLIEQAKIVAEFQLRLDACHANVTGLQASLDAQNVAVEAQRADGERRAKMLSDGLQQARVGRAGAEARAASLLKNAPAGIDACARAEAARAAVLKALP